MPSNQDYYELDEYLNYLDLDSNYFSLNEEINDYKNQKEYATANLENNNVDEVDSQVDKVYTQVATQVNKVNLPVDEVDLQFYQVNSPVFKINSPVIKVDSLVDKIILNNKSPSLKSEVYISSKEITNGESHHRCFKCDRYFGKCKCYRKMYTQYEHICMCTNILKVVCFILLLWLVCKLFNMYQDSNSSPLKY